MEPSKVYFTDLRTHGHTNLPDKLKKLVYAAGIDQIDFENKFVAIKMHLGEPGNLAYLRPNYARAIVGCGTRARWKAFYYRLQHALRWWS